MDSDQIGKRPLRVNTQGDVEMASSRTFDANGSTIVNLGAPAAPTSAAREQDVTLARALANDPDAGGATIVNLGDPSGPTSPVRVQDDAHHIVVNSSDTAMINAALLAGRDPGNTHVVARFTGAGAKKLVLASDIASGSPVGMLVTVLKSASGGGSSVTVEAESGAVNGEMGEVLVQPETTGARSFSLTAFGTSPVTWYFVGQPKVDGGVPASNLAPSVAQCELGSPGTGLGGTFDLSLTLQRGGFSVSGDGLIFATPGLYRVSCVGLMVRSSLNSADAVAAIDLRLGVVAFSGPVVATLRGARNIDSSGNEFLADGQGIFEVTDLSARLWAQNSTSASISIPFANALIVEQIGPAS